MNSVETSQHCRDLERDALRHVALSLLVAACIGLGLSQWEYGLLAPLTFGAMAAVAGRWLPDHPHTDFGLANRITTFRAALVAGLVPFAGAPVAMSWPIIAVMVLALALDGADGWAARRYRTASRFGSRIDQELDAVFMLLLSLLAWRSGAAGAWVLIAGLWRYIFLILTKIAPAFAGALPPSSRRRAICPIVLGGLILSLAPGLPAPAAAIVAAASVILLSASFIADILWLRMHRPVRAGVS
jgi:phosphatidylglycerophosphate synthase